MHALVVRSAGAAPEVGEHPDPQPSAGQALVRVTAAPVTPLDLLCAGGRSYFGAPATPYVPGVQGVGHVLSSSSVATGTRVWFPTSAGMRPGDGSTAELAVAADAALVALPDGVGDGAAAALGLSAVAAWVVLQQRARLAAGEAVLVLGAGGVVGQVAVQAARLLGARRVVGAARSEPARARAVRCGADTVVALEDGDTVDALVTRLGASCDGGFDVVVDPLCGRPATAAVRVLAERGRLVNLGSAAGASMEVDSAWLRSGAREVLGYTNASLTPQRQRDALLEVLEHAARGALAVAHQDVPLDAAAAAWQRQAAGTASVRLVVRPWGRAQDAPAARVTGMLDG